MKSYSFILFAMILLLAFAHSETIETSSCLGDLNSDYFNDTISITSSLAPTSTCFNLVGNWSGQSLSISCNSHDISIGTDSVNFLDTNSSNVSQIFVDSCNIALDSLFSNAVNVHGNTSSVSITNSDINMIATNNTGIQFTDVDVPVLDVNLLGTTIISKNEGYGNLVFQLLDINSLNIYNGTIARTDSSTATLNILISFDWTNDINYMNFYDTNIIYNDGYAFWMTNSDTFLELNFEGSSVYNYANADGFIKNRRSVSTPNYNILTIRNLDANLSSDFSIFNHDADINYFNIIDSNIILNSGSFFSKDSADTDDTSSHTDLNFFGSNIKVLNDARGFNLDTISYDINVSNLDVNFYSTDYLFYFINNPSSVRLFDSNLFIKYDTVNQFAFASSDADINFLIYNNVFYINPNVGLFSVESNGLFSNTDLNTSYNSNNSSSRIRVSDDDSNSTGGNLWYNSTSSDLICSTDQEAPYGICDNPVIIGSDDFVYDNLPIYPFYIADLNVVDISLNSTINGTTSNAICNIQNNSDFNAQADINVLLYVDSVLVDYNTISEDILSNDTLQVTFDWSPDLAGTYDLNCVSDYVGSVRYYDENFTITNPSSGGSSSRRGGSSGNFVPDITSNMNSDLVLTLLLNQVYKFKLGKDDHQLDVLDISDRSARIELRSVPTQYDISLGSSIFKDFNDDGIYDIKVTLDGINAQSKSVKLTVKAVQQKIETNTPTSVPLDKVTKVDINEPKASDTNLETNSYTPVESNRRENSSFNLGIIIIVVLALVIVSILAIFLFSKSRKSGFRYH